MCKLSFLSFIDSKNVLKNTIITQLIASSTYLQEKYIVREKTRYVKTSFFFLKKVSYFEVYYKFDESPTHAYDVQLISMDNHDFSETFSYLLKAMNRNLIASK